MPLTDPHFKEGIIYEPDDVHVMTTAYDEICRAMRLGPTAISQRDAVAKLIIRLMQIGERDPYLLRNRVLREAQR